MTASAARSVIVGASAGLGRALAERLARSGHRLYLIASDARDLDPLGADLRLRYGASVAGHAIDLGAPFDTTALRDEIHGTLGGVDDLFLVAGRFETEHPHEIAPDLMEKMIRVNFGAPLAIANVLLPDLKMARAANCVAIGSIATSRARGRHFVYGACKRGLEFYFDALRHHLVGSRCKVQFYRLGYLRTQMTFGKNLILPVTDPQRAAAVIERGLGRDRGIRYLPWWWRPVMGAYRSIPWPIYRRMVIQ